MADLRVNLIAAAISRVSNGKESLDTCFVRALQHLFAGTKESHGKPIPATAIFEDKEHVGRPKRQQDPTYKLIRFVSVLGRFRSVGSWSPQSPYY